VRDELVINPSVAEDCCCPLSGGFSMHHVWGLLNSQSSVPLVFLFRGYTDKPIKA